MLTVSVAVAPAATYWGTGCAVMPGRAALTVRTAGTEVTRPARFETTTVYDPASDAWTLLSVSVAPVAPGTSVPFLRH